ncbi:hypothetical protein [Maricaulis maris]|uniref:Lipoprotein n=1 Tax=Maricaulis maris TaxID=74318 RepID=A0A495DKG6_9PROT|nr:hypothetical protein [Maricaulis maris]RKR03105.1 hypothetical protein C7435_1053 [Maricaulis maris]
MRHTILSIALSGVAALALSSCASKPEPRVSASQAAFEQALAMALLGPMMEGRSPMSDGELQTRARAAQRYPLGSWDNPVRASGPGGQREYLSRLRCADGQTPRFERLGNFGAGIYRSIVDGYQLDCGSAQPGRVEVYMDMYHPGYREMLPVAGFFIM